jgi:hypothetical protein
MSESKITTDHNQIRNWAEQRDGRPACVKGTGNKKDPGLLRINFPGYAEDNLEDISWDEFFEKFDDNNLALLYQEKTEDGKVNRFSKLIDRNEESGKGSSHTSRRG